MKPTVVHPKQFRLKGTTFEVVADCVLTDPQAEEIVRCFLRTHPFKALPRGSVFRVRHPGNKISGGSRTALV